MTRLPGITGRQLIARLKRQGFEVVRVRGSHHLLNPPDGRPTPGTLRPPFLSPFDKKETFTNDLSYVTILY